MSPGMAVFVAFLTAGLGSMAAIEIWPEVMDRAWVTVANVVTFGLYNRLEERNHMTQSNPFGGVTVAQAAANLSALSCPTMHRNVVPVENLEGETVAALCPDCDRQLPASWATPSEPPALP